MAKVIEAITAIIVSALILLFSLAMTVAPWVIVVWVAFVVAKHFGAF